MYNKNVEQGTSLETGVSRKGFDSSISNLNLVLNTLIKQRDKRG